jgi:hypothetical protein
VKGRLGWPRTLPTDLIVQREITLAAKTSQISEVQLYQEG